MTLIGELQRSRLLSGSGIGAIHDALDYSVVIAGQQAWNLRNTEIVREERLQNKLGISFLRQPVVKADIPTIPAYRFPEWVFCPQCKFLRSIWQLSDPKEKKCAVCGAHYLPARFVVACEKEHITDFPWSWCVHRGSPCDRPKLKLSSTGKTTSLAGITVSCENENCDAAPRTLEGIFGRRALSGYRCSGRRPWLGPGSSGEDCDEIPMVLQRGSASVYFPQTESAISIPPFSERIHIFLRERKVTLEWIPSELLGKYLEGELKQSGEDFRLEDLVEAAKKINDSDDWDERGSNLRLEEYDALRHPNAMDPKSEFAAEEGTVPADFRAKIARIILVRRLREVRVLTGFSRLKPGGEPAPLSTRTEKWLPAMEMKGEGIFLELDDRALADWISKLRPPSLKRIGLIEKNRTRALSSGPRMTDGQTVGPEFLLIHTLAHLLIQQLILDSGYSTASLRERLYINDGSNGSPRMSGLLIYTATSDSEGSLGGLVRQGMESRFNKVIHRALARARWCSNDPLCMESEGQGHNSLNLAACHSCCLLPETSCEYRNSFLDRGVVIGTPLGDQTDGFLSLGSGS